MERLFAKLKGLLEAPVGQREKQWGHDVCKTSREVHKSVWWLSLPKKDVIQLIEILEKLKKALEPINELKDYKENVGIRILSMKSYLNDGMPIMPPNAPEDERAAIERIRKWAEQNPLVSERLLSALISCGA